MLDRRAVSSARRLPDVGSGGRYFQEVADACGDGLGVDTSRRFSGLEGYRRLIESGVEAIALETPPYFFPEHARAAVDAGLHVYMAKPVAVDVWGCLEIEAAARKAAARQRCSWSITRSPRPPEHRGRPAHPRG